MLSVKSGNADIGDVKYKATNLFKHANVIKNMTNGDYTFDKNNLHKFNVLFNVPNINLKRPSTYSDRIFTVSFYNPGQCSKMFSYLGDTEMLSYIVYDDTNNKNFTYQSSVLNADFALGDTLKVRGGELVVLVGCPNGEDWIVVNSTGSCAYWI